VNLAQQLAFRANSIKRYGSTPARCPVCKTEFLNTRDGRKNSRCVECSVAAHNLRGSAAGEVHRAIRLGRLLPAYTFRCTDCEKWAEVYDHRDYLQPLKVEPVCISCNWHRGPAHPFGVTA
jgi:hypothetical protein